MVDEAQEQDAIKMPLRPLQEARHFPILPPHSRRGSADIQENGGYRLPFVTNAFVQSAQSQLIPIGRDHRTARFRGQQAKFTCVATEIQHPAGGAQISPDEFSLDRKIRVGIVVSSLLVASP